MNVSYRFLVIRSTIYTHLTISIGPQCYDCFLRMFLESKSTHTYSLCIWPFCRTLFFALYTNSFYSFSCFFFFCGSVRGGLWFVFRSLNTYNRRSFYFTAFHWTHSHCYLWCFRNFSAIFVVCFSFLYYYPNCWSNMLVALSPNSNICFRTFNSNLQSKMQFVHAPEYIPRNQ